MAALPKIQLIQYLHAADACFRRFFTDFNSDFVCQNGQYVFSSHMSKHRLKAVFKAYIADELKKLVSPCSLLGNDYFFIVGSCLPKDNVLLSVKDSYFPQKLSKLVEAECSIKFFLREKGIKLDLVLFNAAIDELFTEMFKDQKKVLKLLGKDFTNVFFLRHSRLDAPTLCKAVKYAYGKSNVLDTLCDGHASPVLLSVNECIGKYVHNQKLVSSLGTYKLAAAEVKQYIDECMRTANGKKQAKNYTSA